MSHWSLRPLLTAHCPLVAAALFVIMTILLIPIATRFEFGGDEGYELQKAWMLNNGFSLYGNFWNDQPPLHTGIVALLFSIFGHSIAAARLVSVLSAGVLIWTVSSIVRDSSGFFGALMAASLLVASPLFLNLGVSAMLEMPTVALSMVSVYLLLRRRKNMIAQVALAGLVMGLALRNRSQPTYN